VANLLSSFQSSSVDAKPQQQQSRFASTPQASFNNTVEFVTGGDVGGAVTDYQFGFYADSSPTSRENDVDNYKQVANSFLSSANTQTEISPKRLEVRMKQNFLENTIFRLITHCRSSTILM
jgi:hypothetical protein